MLACCRERMTFSFHAVPVVISANLVVHGLATGVPCSFTKAEVEAGQYAGARELRDHQSIPRFTVLDGMIVQCIVFQLVPITQPRDGRFWVAPVTSESMDNHS